MRSIDSVDRERARGRRDASACADRRNRDDRNASPELKRIVRRRRGRSTGSVDRSIGRWVDGVGVANVRPFDPYRCNVSIGASIDRMMRSIGTSIDRMMRSIGTSIDRMIASIRASIDLMMGSIRASIDLMMGSIGTSIDLMMRSILSITSSIPIEPIDRFHRSNRSIDRTHPTDQFHRSTPSINSTARIDSTERIDPRRRLATPTRARARASPLARDENGRTLRSRGRRFGQKRGRTPAVDVPVEFIRRHEMRVRGRGGGGENERRRGDDDEREEVSIERNARGARE